MEISMGTRSPGVDGTDIPRIQRPHIHAATAGDERDAQTVGARRFDAQGQDEDCREQQERWNEVAFHDVPPTVQDGELRVEDLRSLPRSAAWDLVLTNPSGSAADPSCVQRRIAGAETFILSGQEKYANVLK